MMRAGIVRVYLSETGHAVRHRGSPPEKDLKSGNYPFDFALKDYLCAGWQQTTATLGSPSAEKPPVDVL